MGKIKTNNKGVTMKDIILDSVGSVFDPNGNMVYPQNEDGSPDLNCGTYLEDCSDEWWESLSKKDKKAILDSPNCI